MAKYSDNKKFIAVRCRDDIPGKLETISETLRQSKATILQRAIEKEYDSIKYIAKKKSEDSQGKKS